MSGKAWPTYRDELVATLAASPRDAVLFALLTLKEPEFAWNLASSLALDSDDTWSELVKTYEKVDPIALLPVHERLVENGDDRLRVVDSFRGLVVRGVVTVIANRCDRNSPAKRESRSTMG